MVWLKWNEIKFSENFKQKSVKNCSTHFSIKLCIIHKHTDPCLVSDLTLTDQDLIIGYVSLTAKMKSHEVYILWEFRNNTKVLAVMELWMLVVGLGTETYDWVKKGCKISLWLGI